MLNYLYFFLLINFSFALPPDKKCCVNHPKRKHSNLIIANYDCSQLTSFGSERCKSVLGGTVCKWSQCYELKKCQRISKYELHYGKSVDIGLCAGICPTKFPIDSDLVSFNSKLTCSPSQHDFISLKKNEVKVIKECKCQNCGVKPKYDVIKVPKGECVGECVSKRNVCYAGIKDNYVSSNTEVSSPSLALLNSAAGICSLGVQSGFDVFIDNRCFVHTFENCIRESTCPIRTIYLDICIQAAQVSLTNTDSLRLGTNGIGLWGISLPLLNGGSWNPNENLCLTLDLNNLNGGVSILNNVIINGHLDVLVQDDTAVDFLTLTTEYLDCEVCLPVDHTVHSFYSSLGLQQFRHIRDCDCLDVSKCHRERLEETYYPGTDYEITLDVGQCLGKCQNGIFCNKESSLKEIKTPYGVEVIEVIEGCFC